MTRPVIADSLIRAGTMLGVVHVVTALCAHLAVPTSLAGPLGLEADPWFRRETGTVNAGFAYGMLCVLRGRRDATFVRSTAISGLLMAAVRTIATLRGHRRGPLSAMVIGSDLLLGIGGLLVADQFDTESAAS